MTGFPNKTMTEPTVPTVLETPDIPIKRDHDCSAYLWLGKSVVLWAASSPIPTNAFESLRNVWLMLGPDYEHSVDESLIPQDIRILTHVGNAATGPTGCPFFLWSPVKSISVGQGSYEGHQLNRSLQAYILPVQIRAGVLMYIEGSGTLPEIQALQRLDINLPPSVCIKPEPQPRVTSEEMKDWLAESAAIAEKLVTPAMTDTEIENKAIEFGDRLLEEITRAKNMGKLKDLGCRFNAKTSNEKDIKKIASILKRDFMGIHTYCFLSGDGNHYISVSVASKMLH